VSIVREGENEEKKKKVIRRVKGEGWRFESWKGEGISALLLVLL